MTYRSNWGQPPGCEEGRDRSCRRPEEGVVRMGLGLEAKHFSPLGCQ